MYVSDFTLGMFDNLPFIFSNSHQAAAMTFTQQTNRNTITHMSQEWYAVKTAPMHKKFQLCMLAHFRLQAKRLQWRHHSLSLSLSVVMEVFQVDLG